MSLDYWERRQIADDAKIAFANAEETIKRIERLHREAERRIRAMQQRIRQRFRRAYNLSEEEARNLLASPVGREEYLRLLEEIGRLGKNNPMREELLAKAAAPSYAFRLKLAEAMELENDAITARMAEEEQRILEEHLMHTVQDENMRAAFRIQHRAGVAFRVRGVSEELARVIVKRPWSGMSFSARIWRNREKLAEWLNEEFAAGLIVGESGAKLANELHEKMGVSMNRARTLVRTETTHVCSEADFEAYEEAEIETYIYEATLDSRTSRICRKLDHKRFKVKDKQIGVNCPPMHPNCRSTTITGSFTDEELSRMERWARDPVTGKGVKVPADMNYEQWRKLQAKTYSEERVAAGEKMARNKAKDEKQFARYQQILGKKQLPKDIASFQQMKYTEPEEWAEKKRSYLDERKKALPANDKTDTIQSSTKDGGDQLRTVGRISKTMFERITPNITTVEVIITDERIAHSNLHDNAFNKFEKYIPQVLNDPDFVFRDKKPNTGVLIRRIDAEGENLELVLRLHVPEDNPEYKNSIISFWNISDKRKGNYARNKDIVYKRPET